MGVIYEPRGRAREYAPLAANLYVGCNHRCDYCYADRMNRAWGKPFFCENPRPRENVVELIQKDAKKLSGSSVPVLLCFMGDPYCKSESEYRITRSVLECFLEDKIPCSILTKGVAVSDDIELFQKFGRSIKVGMTLTFGDEEKSKKHEPGATSPVERIEILRRLHEAGVPTWASIEPVIEPEQSLEMIKKTMPYCDLYKVGAISGDKFVENAVDWHWFYHNVENILKGKRWYPKNDLRRLVGLKPCGNPDSFDIVRPFDE